MDIRKRKEGREGWRDNGGIGGGWVDEGYVDGRTGSRWMEA